MVRQLGHPGVFQQFLDELPVLVRDVLPERLLLHPAFFCAHIV